MQSVDSTNRAALRRLQESPRPEEAWYIRAETQTEGKGQQGSVWQSPPGENLLVSLVLYPTHLDASELFYISKAVSVGVAGALRALLPHAEVRLKWPNDILLGGKKVAGILIENILIGARLESSVVGIGLNVNQQNFPASLAGHATSLTQAAGHWFDVREVWDVVGGFVLEAYDKLKAQGLMVHDPLYLDWLYRFQTWALYEADGVRFQGMIVGVSKDGQLALQRGEKLCHFQPKALRFC